MPRDKIWHPKLKDIITKCTVCGDGFVCRDVSEGFAWLSAHFERHLIDVKNQLEHRMDNMRDYASDLSKRLNKLENGEMKLV